MAAPKGNTYAEKWTEKEAKSFFDDALALIEEKKEVLFIGTIANELGVDRHTFDYLIGKFPEKKVFATIKKKIQSIIESRTYEKALGGNLNATMAIFGLKNNHGWKDRTEQDVKVTGFIPPKPKGVKRDGIIDEES